MASRGADHNDASCYRDGKVQYEALARTSLFQSGLDRLKTGSKDHKIALMCAEKDPLDCHRTILVARELEKEGFDIRHILANGEIETHDQAMQRLMRTLKLDHGDLFMTDDDAREEAYRIQADAIAYRPDDDRMLARRNQEVQA